MAGHDSTAWRWLAPELDKFCPCVSRENAIQPDPSLKTLSCIGASVVAVSGLSLLEGKETARLELSQV